MRKSNYLAAAMAFAAIVGCQKEFAPVAGIEQAGDAGLDQRPVLASSALTFGGAETRATAGGNGGYNWKWESGDQVGAMLVDQINFNISLPGYVSTTRVGTWNYGQYVKNTPVKVNGAEYVFKKTYKTASANAVLNDAEEFYKLGNEQVWTNYPYTTEDAEVFYTPATLVEGHYMFYAPYNENNGTRGPLVATLPVNQDASESTKAVDAFYKGETPAVLTVNYLSAEKTSTVHPSMGHIYAYPRFTISNEFEGFLFDGAKTKSGYNYISTDVAQTYTMTLKQIEFYAGEEDLLAYKRSIEPIAVNNAVKAKTWLLDAAQASSYENLVATHSFANSVYESSAFTSDELKKMVATPAVDFGAKNPAQRIIVDLGGYELPYGESYSFNVVMPAEDYTDGGLFARIVVEIDGQDYYIVTNEVKNNAYNAKGTVASMPSNPTKAEENHAIIPVSGIEGGDYQFADRHDRSFDKIELARGNRYAKVEINKNNTTKAHAGELLTIELVGGLAQVGVAVAEEAQKKGIETNQDLYDFLNGVDNNAKVEEVLDETKQDDYRHFYLVEDNTVVINAELIKQLDNKLNKGTFTLTTNLPIADDVTVAFLNGNTYRFTTADGKTWYDITYASRANFGPKNGLLTEGINVVNGGELKAGTSVKNAVVFVSGSAIVKNATGIMGIILENDAELEVNSTVDAWVKAAGAKVTVDIKAGKGLTNSANDFSAAAAKGVIKNQALATVAGKISNIAGNVMKVTYVTDGGFGTKTIAKETQINDVMIYSAQKYDNDQPKEVSQADFDLYKNLTKVTYHFDANYAGGFQSKESITVANAVQIIYEGTPAVEWSAPKQDTKVIIKGGSAAAAEFFVNIVAGNGVTLVQNNREYEAGQTPVFDIEAANSATGDVLFGQNIVATNEKTDGSAAFALTSDATLDGNGFALNSTAKYGVQAENGTIKDLTVNATSNNDWSATNTDGWASRAIYAPMTGNVTIEDCVLKGGYALNANGTGTLKVTGTDVYGWCSWSNTETVFEDCNFYKGTYFNTSNTDVENLKSGESEDVVKAIEALGAVSYSNAICRPYNTTTFRNCNFPKDWVFDFSHMASNVKVVFENCTIGGTKLTSAAQFNGYNDTKMLVSKAEQFVKPTWSTTIGGCITIK